VQTLHDRTVRKTRTKVEIDREEEKRPSFNGVRGIAEQDAMVQDSQGLIVDRTRAFDADRHRDRPLRGLMLDGAKALRESKQPAAPSDNRATAWARTRCSPCRVVARSSDGLTAATKRPCDRERMPGS
jgi:hypothetical protein